MATCLLKGYVNQLFYHLNIFFYFFSFGYVLDNQIICHFKGWLCLFKGLRLLFLPNVPAGAAFIQEVTSIPESRVSTNLESTRENKIKKALNYS